MKEIILNSTDIATIDDVHSLFAQELSFPSWYGNNLDALFDCLTEISEPVQIVLDNRENLCGKLGPKGSALCSMLTQACRESDFLTLVEEL